MARKISLSVNSNPIKLDYFVEGFVYHVTEGVLAALKDTGPIKKMELDIDKNNDVKIILNGKDISLNIFTTDIIHNTLMGMVGNLKGVEGKPKTLEMRIEQ